MGPPVLRAIDTSSILDKVDVRENPFRILHTLRALWRTGAESGKVGRESRLGRKGCVTSGEAFDFLGFRTLPANEL